MINEGYLLKKYTRMEQMEQSIKINKALTAEGLPVAVPIPTKADAHYLFQEAYWLYPRLKGTGLKDPFTGDASKQASDLGRIIGELHRAFLKLEGIILCREQQLLEEVNQWALSLVR